MQSEELLTVAEVATLLRVSEETVRRWAREETIESIRIAGMVRIPSAQLSRFRFGGGGR